MQAVTTKILVASALLFVNVAVAIEAGPVVVLSLLLSVPLAVRLFAG